MTNNSDLLNLHVRQQHPLPNEQMRMISGWLKALARALNENLVRIQKDFSKKQKNYQNLMMTKRVLLLQSNWMHYTSYWIFLHMIMKVYIIKADATKLKKRLSLHMLFVPPLYSAKLNHAKNEAFI